VLEGLRTRRDASDLHALPALRRRTARTTAGRLGAWVRKPLGSPLRGFLVELAEIELVVTPAATNCTSTVSATTNSHSRPTE
jgi:hypothetical protein